VSPFSKSIHAVIFFLYLSIGNILERLDSQRPYLIEHTSITPDITGCGVLVIVECLRGCPLNRDFPSMRDINTFLLQISGEAKICNLKKGDIN
jgi:hypothetical protein